MRILFWVAAAIGSGVSVAGDRAVGSKLGSNLRALPQGAPPALQRALSRLPGAAGGGRVSRRGSPPQRHRAVWAGPVLSYRTAHCYSPPLGGGGDYAVISLTTPQP